MKNKIKRTVGLFVTMCLFACQEKKSSQGEAFLSKIDQNEGGIVDDSEKLSFFDKPRKAKNTAFTALPTGSTRPKGWLLDIMRQDLENGIAGNLDELYPGIASDDIYHKHRRGGLDDVPEMGDLVLTGAAWEQSIMWWNAETIGNWWDGFVRHAFLLDKAKAKEQSRAIVENLLESQDADGYLGIYKKNLRYQHKGSNGELWAQTTAFRMLLAYYEFTGDERVLNAVERAMALTMEKYGEKGKNPFDLKSAFGGATHGLMLTDVCETLHRITGNTTYQDYASYLYRAFSSYSINRSFNDLRYPFLVQKDSMFTGHAVHVYEHLRSLINSYYHTGYEELELAYHNALHKLDKCILPSGAGHGNEWIYGLNANATHTAAEFCGLLELRNFYGSAIQKTGNVTFADAAEKLTYNAILGFRNADGSAITYGKPDNCYILNGKSLSQEEEESRLKYSPTHSEPAVCCTPNYTRNFPHFLDQMWMKNETGVAALLYGPSVMQTEINGVKVHIEQKTDYPFSDTAVFEISADMPVSFKLSFRKPNWSKSIQFHGVSDQPELVDGYYRINREWRNGDSISLIFENEVQPKEFGDGETYFQRGALVYALPIPHIEQVVKTYGIRNFKDYYCLPLDEGLQNMTLPAEATAVHLVSPNTKNLFESNTLQVTLKNGGADREVALVPMAHTILRKVTFEKED